MDFLIFFVSMVSLIYGADFIINEAERIATHFKIPHFIIGATLVAFGTSLPEMAASITASVTHKSDMAVSNVIGSVVFNITLVLGVVFIISSKIRPKRDLFAKDSAWALFPLLIFLLMSYDNVISRVEGVLFITLMAGYILFLVVDAKELLAMETHEYDKESFSWSKSLLPLIIGFVMVVLGATFTIESGSSIARSFGISEWMIGLFLISFGTSLPELVVSLTAARKGNADMSIGNIIGSNVANFTMVLGSAALVNPLTIDTVANQFDIFVTIVATLMLLFITANRLYNRSAGIALLIVLFLFINNSASAL